MSMLFRTVMPDAWGRSRWYGPEEATDVEKDFGVVLVPLELVTVVGCYDSPRGPRFDAMIWTGEAWIWSRDRNEPNRRTRSAPTRWCYAPIQGDAPKPWHRTSEDMPDDCAVVRDCRGQLVAYDHEALLWVDLDGEPLESVNEYWRHLEPEERESLPGGYKLPVQGATERARVVGGEPSAGGRGACPRCGGWGGAPESHCRRRGSSDAGDQAAQARPKSVRGAGARAGRFP